MSRFRLALVTTVLLLLVGTKAQAQQPQKPDSVAAGMMGMSGTCMGSMSGADQRLGQLMDAMHAAPPSRRMAAMMAVMNELAAQNREMRAHMMGMMHGMQMMEMGTHGGGGPMGKAPGQPDSRPLPDSAGHGQPH